VYAHDNYFIDRDNKIYNVGIYLRLSREDETTGQSESINNQKDFLTGYILEKNWNIINIYIDDGYSGLNFDRPGFKKMIADIENKKIDLVITKDLSRLGRDYIDTGYYIERYFPQKRVRYIALNDGIDTFGNTTNNDMSPFKSVINDMYAKDISKKIRAVMDTKRINGKFIGAFAPYGYVKDSKDKNKLIIDEQSANVVKRIFEMYISGDSMSKIVKIFNDEKILTPTEYKNKIQNLAYVNTSSKYGIWRQETIKIILTNPTYIGNMTQRRSEKINYKLKKFKKIPKKDWITAENTHEAVIDEETFKQVQVMIQKKACVYYPNPIKRESHLLAGIIFCGDCGKPMTFRRHGKTKKEFIAICSSYSRFGAYKCERNAINESLLNQYVLEEFKQMSNQLINKADFLSEFQNQELKSKTDIIQKELEKINKRLEEIKKIIKSLYEDKVREIISEDDFIQMSKEFNEEKNSLSEKHTRLIETPEEKILSYAETLNLIEKIIDFEHVDKILLNQLIKKIEIFKNKEIIINYAFQEPNKI